MARKPKSAAAPSSIIQCSNPANEAVSINPKSRLPSLKKAANNKKIVVVRRSGRVLNMVSPKRNETKDLVADPINLVESENEDLMHGEQSDSESEPEPEPEPELEPTPIKMSVEEKIDHLIEIVNEIKSKGTKRVNFSGETSYAELNYKSMYIESQKQIEELREKNQELTQELQFSRGKIEVYDKMKDVIFQVKESLYFSSLGKTTEAMMNFTSQTSLDKSRLLDADIPPDATENLTVAQKNVGRPKKKAAKAAK